MNSKRFTSCREHYNTMDVVSVRQARRKGYPVKKLKRCEACKGIFIDKKHLHLKKRLDK